MSKLPVGYLDMSRDDYDDLHVVVLRAAFSVARDIVRYTMGVGGADDAIKAHCPVTPVDWMMAVTTVEGSCDRCKSSGTYSWGACINGKMSHSAPCARCGGKGYMTFDDMRRGRAYDRHAISRACR